MSFKLPSIAPPRGVQIDQYKVTLKNVTAATIGKGEIVVLDLANGDGDVNDNNQDMGLDSGFVCFVDVDGTAANNGPGIYGVTLEEITAGNEGSVCISGVVDAVVDGGTTDVAAGDALACILSGGVGMLQASAADADNAIVAVALEANTAAGAAGTFHKILLDGFAINRA